MNETWSVGVLPAEVENVEMVAAGEEPSVEAAIEAASEAFAVLATDRGRAEYRLTVAGTEMIVFPGLIDDGAVDVEGSRRTIGEHVRASRA
jgi:hypothetical protein